MARQSSAWLDTDMARNDVVPFDEEITERVIIPVRRRVANDLVDTIRAPSTTMLRDWRIAVAFASGLASGVMVALLTWMLAS